MRGACPESTSNPRRAQLETAKLLLRRMPLIDGVGWTSAGHSLFMQLNASTEVHHPRSPTLAHARPRPSPISPAPPALAILHSPLSRTRPHLARPTHPAPSVLTGCA